MKSMCSVFILVIFFSLAGFGNAADAGPKTAPIATAVLELMQHQDKNVSLGAMLISTDIYDNADLEKYVRSSLKAADPAWEAAIKWYVLSRYTLSDEDTKNFIAAIPQDKDNFSRLISFESSVTRHPGSKILTSLLGLARNSGNPELQSLAVDKLDRVRSVADGWVADSIRPQY